METSHRVVVGDSRDMADVPADSVELVVTSPPYPMVEMWDETFSQLRASIGHALERGNGRRAFEQMHEELDRTWAEVERVLVEGGIACINIGDATRTLGDRFRVYQNHSRIVDAFESLGFDPLPEILWRKPTNSAAKFMGSGMLPPNAYPTLEHEYLLPFRNGGRRSFEPKADRRYEAAYFWEERNDWFSDVWMDITGTLQALGEDDIRERSGAFPFEIPYRLINMFSVYGDTVLDPFWGTGTTSLAGMVAARDSIGYELDAGFTAVFDDRVGSVPEMSGDVIRRRLDRHRAFVEKRREDGDPPSYESREYGFPVVTKQERDIRFYRAEAVEGESDTYTVEHAPF
ncbi:MAG: site-specific DNA-methyltransferase [Halodesulfurarchaeum sp.]